MERESVSSSSIASVGYDSSTSVLEVGFCNGRVYQYSGVPQEVYDGLMNASSHGKYFNREIKGAYGYVRV